MKVCIAWVAGALFGMVLLAGTSMAAEKAYPVDDFARVTQCMMNPACTVEPEDRIEGPLSDARPFAYEGVCLGGGILVCTEEACWSEADETC